VKEEEELFDEKHFLPPPKPISRLKSLKLKARFTKRRTKMLQKMESDMEAREKEDTMQSEQRRLAEAKADNERLRVDVHNLRARVIVLKRKLGESSVASESINEEPIMEGSDDCEMPSVEGLDGFEEGDGSDTLEVFATWKRELAEAKTFEEFKPPAFNLDDVPQPVGSEDDPAMPVLMYTDAPLIEEDLYLGVH